MTDSHDLLKALIAWDGASQPDAVVDGFLRSLPPTIADDKDVRHEFGKPGDLAPAATNFTDGDDDGDYA